MELLPRFIRCLFPTLLLPIVVHESADAALSVSACLTRWDCKWQDDIPFAPTEGTCSALRDGYYPNGPSVVAPPGPCNLRVECVRRMVLNYSEMFQCMEYITGHADVRSLDLVRCDALEIRNGDLDPFPNLETFNITYSSIKRMDDEIFYNSTKLATIDIFQDYYGSAIDGYPAALIGPDALPPKNVPLSKNETAFLPSLRHLILGSFSFTSGIPRNAFQNLGSLTMLKFGYVILGNSELESIRGLRELEHFEIYYSPQLNALPLDISSSMPKLRHFQLSFTNVSSITKDHLFHFRELETLILGDQLVEIDQEAFDNLLHLTGLSLHGNAKLTDLPDFNRIERIEDIDLGSCAISNLDLTRFTSLGQLKVLRLGGNRLTTIPRLFANFPNETNSLERIEIIDMSWNMIRSLGEYTFSNLAFLRSIGLQGNSISIVRFRAFFNLAALSEVRLDRNAIVALDQQAFYAINTLQMLDLSRNNLTNFPQFPYHVNWEPGAMDLPVNPFRTIISVNPMQCDCEMFPGLFAHVGENEWELSFYHQYIWPGNYFLSNQMFSESQSLQCQTVLDGFQRIDNMLENPEAFRSPISNECPRPCSCFRQCTTDAVFAVCKDGNITGVPSTLGDSINVLNLRRNNIATLDRTSFEHLARLTFLDLAENQISSIRENTFHGLAYLEVIILNHNSLTRIGPGIFDITSPNFGSLDLSSNLIREIDERSFETIPALRTLRLADNEIETLPRGVFDNLTDLSYFTVADNPLNCSCDMLDLTDWYIRVAFVPEKQFYSDIATIGCAPFSNESQLYEWMEQQEVICSPHPTAATITKLVLTENPYRWTGLIVSVSCTVVITALIGLLVYRYRLEIMVIIYIRTGTRIFNKDNTKEEKDKEFDAFLSFSSLDQSFVLGELIPKLESQENRRKLCIHHRDFIAGECIVTNIVNAIESSRKILILCSENYLESEWCSYEFKTAHQQALKDRSRRVVLVMMERIDDCKLDKAIKAYISTNTYLDKNDPLFWSKLLYSIPASELKSNEMRDINANADNLENTTESNL